MEHVNACPRSCPLQPEDTDAAELVLKGLATAAYRHELVLRIRGTAGRIRTRLPASVAIITESTADWCRVELRVERLDWLPGVLAALDLPFVVERPDELRDLVVALADRLRNSALS